MGFKTGISLLALALAISPAHAEQAPNAAPTHLLNINDPSIPAVTPQSTAARTTPVAPPSDPRQPLAAFQPGLPYVVPREGLPAPVTNLSQAIAFAYKNSPRLLSQRATLRATDHKVPEARSAYGPTLNVTGSMAYTTDRNDSILGTTTTASGWVESASAVLTQPVMTFGRTIAAVADAQAQVSYARAQLRIIESQAVLAVVTDYVAVLRDAAAVTIARQSLAILDKEYNDDRTRARVHEITVADLNQVESRMQAARGSLEQAMGQLGVSQANFMRDVSAPPGELEAPDVLRVPASSLEAAFSIGDRESPVVRAAQEREKISRSQIDAAKAEFMPRVDLRGTAAVGALTPYNDALRTHRLQGEVLVTVPLLDGGNRIAKLGEVRDINQADWLLIDAALRDTRAAITSAWEQLASSRAALVYYLKATLAARDAYQGAQMQHRAGDRTTLDVLDMARDLLLVETNYNTALSNEYLARANLISALGRLEAPQLVKDTDPYDPEIHHRHAVNAVAVLQGTPLMALDGLLIDTTPPADRPIRDPGAKQTMRANMPMPPESSILRIDPSIFAPQ